MLQTEQNLLIFVERLPALSPVASALLISLQQKVLIHWGSYLCFHAFFRINNACCVTLLVPLCGFCTCTSELRNLYTSLVEHTSFFAGFHRTISLLLDGTVWVRIIVEEAWLSKISEISSVFQILELGSQRSATVWGRLGLVTGRFKWLWIEFQTREPRGTPNTWISFMNLHGTLISKGLFHLKNGSPKNRFAISVLR